MLYLRNLILTWLVLLPILVCLPLVLLLYRTGLERVGTGVPAWLPAAAGSAALFVATFNACVMLPSHRPIRGEAIAYATPRAIVARIILPTCAWALCLPATLRAFCAPPFSDHLGLASAALAAGYLVVQFAAYGAAMVRGDRRADPGYELYEWNVLPWFGASLAASALIGVGTDLALAGLGAGQPAPFDAPPFDPALANVSQWLTLFAPLGFVVAHLIQSVLFIGLRHGARLVDLDREWAARADGQILLAAVAWTVLCLCCLALSEALPAILGTGDWTRWPAWAASGAALLSGPAAAWLGKQVFARVQAMAARRPSDEWLLLGLNVLAVVFAVGLFAALTWVLRSVLAHAQIALGGCDAAMLGAYREAYKTYCNYPSVYDWVPFPLQLVIGLLMGAAVLVFGSVNVNRFSMHGVYRNRLTRGFLGSARTTRDGDPFTDFDEGDSPRIHELTTPERRLLPVVNMTLNLTQIRRTDWAERKAAPFTATPFALGSAALDRGEGEPGAAPSRPRGAYVRAASYAGKETASDTRNAGKGPLLGGLLTISGAAVSPNWGYHSSPTIAFLMTMFNVRLGAWLPNPAVAAESDLAVAKPRNSVLALLSELGGKSSDTKQAVYLSDGGHFDNLGLYEMLRRRCARIVVIDAGQDEACSFADLGSVIRKAEIDGLAKVQMGEMRIYARSAAERDPRHADGLGYARGTIAYPGARDAATLIYIKPSYLADIPADVRAYGARNPCFPHESTANQWFSESQFESYRALGYHQVNRMFGSRLTSLSEWASHLDTEIGRGGARA